MSDRADLVTGTLFVTVALDALKALLKTDKFLLFLNHEKGRHLGDTVDRSTESKKAAEETYVASAAARHRHRKSKYLNTHM